MTFDEISDGFCEISLWNRISLKDIFGNGKPILVPIALFASLGRWGLGTRIKGLMGHRTFELIQIFLIGCLKKEILNRSQNVHAHCWQEN